MEIYKITNLINGKIYVGMTKQNKLVRFEQHIKKSNNQKLNYPILNAIRKYGKENFKVETICECENFHTLIKKEIFWINKLNSLVPNGYNIAKGGNGGDLISNHPNLKFIKQKMSKSKMGTKNYFYGKHHSEISINKIKNNMPDMSGNKNAFCGKHHNNETKILISEQNKKRTKELNSFYGKHHSEITKHVLREKAKLRTHTQQTKNKIGDWGKINNVGNKNGNFTIYSINTPSNETLFLNGLEEIKKYFKGILSYQRLLKSNKCCGYKIFNKTKINKKCSVVESE